MREDIIPLELAIISWVIRVDTAILLEDKIISLGNVQDIAIQPDLKITSLVIGQVDLLLVNVIPHLAITFSVLMLDK